MRSSRRYRARATKRSSKEAIFDPLGMHDTGYDHPETVLPHRASGYTRTGGELENASYLDMAQPYAAGSLYSTVEDLARWDQALADGKLIGKDSYAKMFTPVKDNYAYGVSVATRFGQEGNRPRRRDQRFREPQPFLPRAERLRRRAVQRAAR